MKYAIALALLIAAILTGCGTIRLPRPCETAKIGCIQYANAAWFAERLKGNKCEVVTCTLPGYTDERHALIAVREDGKERFYDPAFGFYRKNIGVEHYRTMGTSRGFCDILGDVGTNQDGSN